jgi:preprotein translocase subunit YajC
MSKSKNAVNEIKKLMVQFGFMTEEAIPQSFKLQDNTIINAEALEVGKSVVKISAEFEAVSLEDGKYRTKDHFEFEVSNGQITAVKEIFVEAKLKDGTIVKVEGDSLAEGAAVKVVTDDMPDGIPAPDGVHMLEDGTEVETKDGIIASIKEAIKEGDAEVDASEDEMPEGVDGGDPIQIELMEMLKDFMKKMAEKMSQMEQKMSTVENDFNAFKSEPAAKKIADGKTEFNNVSNAADDKVSAILALRNANKK